MLASTDGVLGSQSGLVCTTWYLEVTALQKVLKTVAKLTVLTMRQRGLPRVSYLVKVD